MKSVKSLALPATLTLLLISGVARAEPTWSYSFSTDTGVVTSDDGSLGQVSLLPASGGPITGSKDTGGGIVAATLQATGPALGTTAIFTNRAYGLTMHLTDLGSGKSGDVSFTGVLNGSLSSTFNLTNSFPNSTQSLNLGGNQYTVTPGLFVPPTQGVPGSVGANVSVTPGAAINDVPEPTALLLAAVGASALGLQRWRRKRQPAGA
jgi:hypothetical protein